MPQASLSSRYSRTELRQCIVDMRLELYNRGVAFGAKALRRHLAELDVRPLPSCTSIGRVLSEESLTHRRTGYYPEDYR